MSSPHHFSCTNQSTQRHEESLAIRRLIAVLERNLDSINTTISIPPPNNLNCCQSHECSSLIGSNINLNIPTKKARKSKEISVEPKPESSKRKKSKLSHTITKPVSKDDPYFTYITQPATQINTPQKPKKTYIGKHPQCLNCQYHHSTTSPCRLCTSCNRLGHFNIYCRTHPITQNTTTPTNRRCYLCGDRDHYIKACPLSQSTTSAMPIPQFDLDQNNQAFVLSPNQAPVIKEEVMSP